MTEEDKPTPQENTDDEHEKDAGTESALAPSSTEGIPSNIRSLKDLIDRVTGRNIKYLSYQSDAGLAEKWPFPFLALVGQREMKLGLLLALINPAVGGVLLVGPRGTGKTTAARSLIDLVPSVRTSNCYYGCMEEDIEVGGIDAVCPNCAEKFGRGEALSSLRPVRLVELPLNARLEDVVGTMDERAALHARMRVQRGILSFADKNILYVDEVNLLTNQVVDSILDAAAQGSYTVRRGPVVATYRSRFTLIGSMNPEEGQLRPQILDRFGLRLIVHGLAEEADRLEAYHRARAYLNNPQSMADVWAEETMIAQDEIQTAQDLLPEVRLPDEVAAKGLKLIRDLDIASLRAEITLFEASRALAAADGRTEVSVEDLLTVAPMALRIRRSSFIDQYFADQQSEEEEIHGLVASAAEGSQEAASDKDEADNSDEE